MSGRKRPHSLEWQLLVLVPLALTAFGLVMVYSATSAPAALGNGNPVGYLERQASTRRSASCCSSSPRAPTSGSCARSRRR